MPKKRDKAQYVNQARRSIEEEFRRLPIFDRARSIAIYNYVRVSEVDALVSHALDPLSGLSHSHRRMVEGSTHAIPAIFQHCDNSLVEEPDLREDGYYDEAEELYKFASKFEQIRYAYSLAERGQFRIYVAQKDPRITFTYTSPDADRADTILRSSEILSAFSPKEDNGDESINELLEELRPYVKATKRVSCDYEYSERLFEIARRYGHAKLSRTNQLQLPEGINIGELTVRDLHAFWAAMMVVVEIHIAAHWIGDDGLLNDLPINTIVLCKPRGEFVSIISNISGLSVEQVGQMLDWFTYDPRISDGVPILQPFLPLSGNLLCLPSCFVNGNNFERNFRKLMQLHPYLIQFREGVNRNLEPAALDSLSELFPEPQYRVRRQVKIPKTDIDLLIFDFATNHVLVIQHKWLIGPDTLNESISNDDEIDRGVYQAVQSRNFLRDNPDFLRARLDLSKGHDLGAVEGTVICRGITGTGFRTANEVPIVIENALRELVAQAENLNQLWNLLNTRPDYTHARDSSAEMKTHIHLCGYEFVIPGLAVQLPEAKEG